MSLAQGLSAPHVKGGASARASNMDVRALTCDSACLCTTLLWHTLSMPSVCMGYSLVRARRRAVQSVAGCELAVGDVTVRAGLGRYVMLQLQQQRLLGFVTGIWGGHHEVFRVQHLEADAIGEDAVRARDGLLVAAALAAAADHRQRGDWMVYQHEADQRVELCALHCCEAQLRPGT